MCEKAESLTGRSESLSRATEPTKLDYLMKKKQRLEEELIIVNKAIEVFNSNPDAEELYALLYRAIRG